MELLNISAKMMDWTLIWSQSLIPVVMAGIIAVYSLVIAVLIAGDIEPPPGQKYSLYKFVGPFHISNCHSDAEINEAVSVDSCILQPVYL